MIKPKKLEYGNTIGVVATSSPADREKVLRAKDELERLGFKVKLMPSCFEVHGYLSGSDQLRADDLNSLFADKDVDGIICLRGGYGSTKILGKVDFDLIKANPKVFVGYSDITALHISMNQFSNLVTFHGPMLAADMPTGLDEFSKTELLRAITDPSPMGPINNPVGIKIHTLVGGKATGIIAGGNLALIAATMGTPYEIDTKDKLLFLEEIGEEPYRVDRMLTQLALAGKFDDAAGIILGDWNNCEASKHKVSLTLMEVFREIIVPFNKPTIFDLKAGHCNPKVTLPFGVKATLYADAGQLTIEEGATL